MDAALGHYREYLIRERGLAPATVREYVDAVRPFILSRLTADQQTLRWDSLDAAAVIGFVVARTSKQSRGAAKLTVTALRSLLGFLHVEGRITQRTGRSRTGGRRVAVDRTAERTHACCGARTRGVL
jgi:site-specific recombinase XerC